jgi:hypothetical protein
MAEAPKPPTKKTLSKGTPPAELEMSANLQKANEGDAAQLTFKVSKEFKKDFRGVAFEEEISMTDLLKKCFELYQKHKYGNTEL